MSSMHYPVVSMRCMCCMCLYVRTVICRRRFFLAKLFMWQHEFPTSHCLRCATRIVSLCLWGVVGVLTLGLAAKVS